METAAGQKQQFTPAAHALGETAKTFKRPLEPVERISEIWFGLVMVLSFTCSIGVAQAGSEEVGTMLRAAVGCNLAWGIIDAFLYLLACFVERGRSITALRAVQQASDADRGQRIIAEAMPPLLASVLSPAEFERMRLKLRQLPEPPRHPWLTKNDWFGAVAVFLAVFLSTFPVAIPFLIVGNAGLALRISNAVAVVMLFLTGYAFGRYAGYRPWRMGLGMAVAGSALVAITIALGG
jgi:VIT family